MQIVIGITTICPQSEFRRLPIETNLEVWIGFVIGLFFKVFIHMHLLTL